MTTRISLCENGFDPITDERYVWCVICPQTFSCLVIAGLFYGWGALNEAINEVYNPGNVYAFANQHGTFTGVVILVFSVLPLPIIRLILDNKLITEFQLQAVGLVMTPFGLFMGGIALQYKQLYSLYILCALPCGLGFACVIQRAIFIHQLWYKRIQKADIGAGVLGFAVGLWATLFFLLSVPMLQAFPIHTVLYIYAAMCPAVVAVPLFCSRDVDASIIHPVADTQHANSNDNTGGDKVERGESDGPTTTVASNTSTTSSYKDTERELDVSLQKGRGWNYSKFFVITNRAPILITDSQLQLPSYSLSSLSLSLSTVVDEGGEFDLTYSEIFRHPTAWGVFVFFSAVLTPGWGIKLGEALSVF